jgi:hypothetical protein
VCVCACVRVCVGGGRARAATYCKAHVLFGIQVVIFPDCIREVTGSDLCQDTDCPKVLHGFPHSLHATARMIPVLSY